MITSYDFNCSRAGCKATVHVTMHMHDSHEWDLVQLGRALGFQQVGPVAFTNRPWQCISHEAETEAPRG